MAKTPNPKEDEDRPKRRPLAGRSSSDKSAEQPSPARSRKSTGKAPDKSASSKEGASSNAKRIPADGKSEPLSSDADSPFGGGGEFTPRSTSRYVTPHQSQGDLMKWIGGALVVLVLAGGGYFVFKDLGKGTHSPATEQVSGGYQNIGRNYFFAPPSDAWTRDSSLAEPGLDLAFRRADLDGWIKIRSEVVVDAPTEGRIIDEVRTDWEEHSARLADFSAARVRWGDLAALEITALDPADGRKRQALVFHAGGVVYRLEFVGPRERFESLARDFDVARRQFRLLAAKGGEFIASPLSVSGTQFAGKRLDYAVEVSQKGWRENSELNAGGRFADLKLIAPDKDVTFIVCARESEDVASVEKLYLRRLEKYSQGMTLKSSRDERSIGGLPAYSLQAMVTQADGEYLVTVTFVRGQKNVFWFEGRTPTQKSAVYTPILDQIVSSFRVASEQPRPAANVLASVPKATPSSDLQRDNLEGTSEKVAGVGKPPLETDKSRPENADASEAGAPKVASGPTPSRPQPSGKSSAAADANFKTLDDLD